MPDIERLKLLVVLFKKPDVKWADSLFALCIEAYSCIVYPCGSILAEMICTLSTLFID